MKQIVFLFAVLMTAICVPGRGQTTYTVQSVTANATVSSTATVVVCKGTAAMTLTLPASPATGRTVIIVNHGTADVTLSPAVRVTNGKQSALLPKYVSEFTSGISTNKITVVWDGTEWRLAG